MDRDNMPTEYLLRLDLDLETQIECIALLKNMLSFMHDIKFFDINNVKKIELIKKLTYGCIIELNKPISVKMTHYLEFALGSDPKKQICALINYYKFNMEYHNRLFTIKKYASGVVIQAKKYDITKEIKLHVSSNVRTKQRF